MEQLDRIRLIISESAHVHEGRYRGGKGRYRGGDGWGSRLIGESRIKVILANLWNKSLQICPYSGPKNLHLTTNPYGCYQCSSAEYMGVDQDGEDMWF